MTPSNQVFLSVNTFNSAISVVTYVTSQLHAYSHYMQYTCKAIYIDTKSKILLVETSIQVFNNFKPFVESDIRIKTV